MLYDWKFKTHTLRLLMKKAGEQAFRIINALECEHYDEIQYTYTTQYQIYAIFAYKK